MKIVKSALACFSTYSRIPMPHVTLNSDDMKYALAFFSLIGAVIGALEYGLFLVCQYCDMPSFVFACLGACIPVIITGGIHVDGYMDTMDALNSYGDREKKLAIMKDPHAGAFAVIWLAVYGLIYIAFLYMINTNGILLFSLSFVISRACSGFSVCTINSAKNEGMLHDVKANSSNVLIAVVNALTAIACIGIVLIFDWICGLAALAVLIIVYCMYRYKCRKEFGGITGDTSGFYLCTVELMLVIVAALEGIL